MGRLAKNNRERAGTRITAAPALRSLMRGEIVSVYQLSKVYYREEMCLICV